jgi:hypothetical protein
MNIIMVMNFFMQLQYIYSGSPSSTMMQSFLFFVLSPSFHQSDKVILCGNAVFFFHNTAFSYKSNDKTNECTIAASVGTAND